MSRVCYTDLKKDSLALLAQINVLDRNTFQRRLAKLFREDEIGGAASSSSHSEADAKDCPAERGGVLGFADRAVHASSADQCED